MDGYSRKTIQSPLSKTDQAVDFIIGNTMFFAFHEAGHMLISEFGLPVLGNEEDAADSAAVFFMLEAGDDRFQKMLAHAAKGWQLVAGYKNGDDDVDLWDAHRLSEQRAYGIVCMMVGSNRKKFKRIADEYELPDERRDECEEEYQLVSDSWHKLLSPYKASKSHETHFTIDYRKPESRSLSRYVKLFRDADVLEVIEKAYATPYKLENGIKITADECGEDNAYWSADDREITICYELAEYYSKLFAYSLADRSD